MTRKWRNNIRKNDLPVFRRMVRRIRGDRAPVFLEFAFALPLLMVLSLFIIELCMFWDTEVMANHAAFAVARIAKVNVNNGRKGLDIVNPYQDMTLSSGTYKADKLVTAMFMMPCTFAWMGTPDNGSKVDFRDYFTINKPLFNVTVDNDTNVMVKLMADILKKLLDSFDTKLRDYLNNKLRGLVDDIFGGQFVGEMNARFNMAMQRVRMDGTVVTRITQAGGSLAYPTGEHPSDPYYNPHVVQVAINYPLHKGAWLYAPFAYWKSGSSSAGNDGSRTPVACGRYAMLVEPGKPYLFELKATDSGDPDIDPNKWKKRGEKKAAKVVNDTSNIIDKWEKAVKHRVALQKRYGGFKKASKHKSFTDAIRKERELWSKVKRGVNRFMDILYKPPKSGGLCGDKSQNFSFTCGSETPFTKCARSECGKLRYCDKVAGKIKRVADKYGLYKGKKPKLIHYVSKSDARPGYHPRISGEAIDCPWENFCKPY